MSRLSMGEVDYAFTSEDIEEAVTKKSPGNYGLGHIHKEGGLVPKYVGRSDSDLREELRQKLNVKVNNERMGGKYSRFKFSYAESATEAYERECQNYHDFLSQLDNKIHPAKPEGTNLKCSVCGE